MSSARYGLIALLALVAGVCLSCSATKKSTGPEPTVPVAPQGLYASQITPTAITLRWLYSSSGIQGFRVYMTPDSTTAFKLTDSSSAAARQITVDSLQIGHPYFFYVTAYGQDGESLPSNTLHTSTEGITAPHAPDLLIATAVATDSVHLTWRVNGGQDHFIVQRHDSGSAVWTTVDSLVSGLVSQYYDTTVAFSTSYYYRVGAQNTIGIAWSVDSAYVAVPSPGAPLAPINLHAQVHLETNSVILTWTNVSADVDSILVARSAAGGPIQNLGYVGSTVTTYTDSIGTLFGTYSYRLKAMNAFGETWSLTVTVNFRLCSNGVIPICVGNHWIYSVTDTAGGPFSARRDVSHAVFFQNKDYYLITNSQGGSTDSLYYLRNDSLTPGCSMLHWPLLQSDHPQLLFKYPATQPADSYHVDDHLVEIVTALPGIDKTVGSTVYHGVITYDWYVGGPNHWIRFYVKPLDVGIILEEEYIGTHEHPGNPVAVRSLVDFVVLNAP